MRKNRQGCVESNRLEETRRLENGRGRKGRDQSSLTKQ
jgi:hypothetical protein